MLTTIPLPLPPRPLPYLFSSSDFKHPPVKLTPSHSPARLHTQTQNITPTPTNNPVFPKNQLGRHPTKLISPLLLARQISRKTASHQISKPLGLNPSFFSHLPNSAIPTRAVVGNGIRGGGRSYGAHIRYGDAEGRWLVQHFADLDGCAVDHRVEKVPFLKRGIDSKWELE
ncbi:uncharacterized protein BDZ99DRAFT_468268 [Mytilinidion resinicola]|uniref:Uncharacterized protein n=1 Tax=Mytilinidion resinicola TaxID=574789 RepID=A0A6A6Y389_9PEZI|nr:uncharacterized protein BDZ99DRAFT_468268 [Mytilinidion resinicola]KAF2803291.1 hypothetical protein BDZ99DRAFT_468268 [Mytilinidion resinicola]